MMKMHEITTASASWATGRFAHTLTIFADHRSADNFVRLTRENVDVRVAGIEEVGDDHVKILVGCSTQELCDQLQDAW